MCRVSLSRHYKALIVASVLAGGGGYGSLAYAQSDQTGTGDADTPQFAVTEPEVVIVEPLAQRSTIGAPIQTVTLSRAVAYKDLDLHTGPGVFAFRQRVKDTARSLCDRLAFRYPIGTPDKRDCYKSATEQATMQADAMIAAYRRPMPTTSAANRP